MNFFFLVLYIFHPICRNCLRQCYQSLHLYFLTLGRDQSNGKIDFTEPSSLEDGPCRRMNSLTILTPKVILLKSNSFPNPNFNFLFNLWVSFKILFLCLICLISFSQPWAGSFCWMRNQKESDSGTFLWLKIWNTTTLPVLKRTFSYKTIMCII